MPKRKTTEQFIKEARKVHGNKYDYSKTAYEYARKKVVIICPDHGEFMQQPINHVNLKHGCPICGAIRMGKKGRIKYEEFILRAKKIHSNKYDYSKMSQDIHSLKKITFTCPEHGDFKQTIASHLKGDGCKKCVKSKVVDRKRIEHKNKLICDLKKIYGNKYDYSNINYINVATPVTLVCKKHGEFKERPRNLTRGYGCPVCDKRGVFKNKKTIEQFIKEAREVHGDKYDYSKVEYISGHTKVIIICPEHGEFKQQASAHVNLKHGCPICAGRRINYLSYNDAKIFLSSLNLRRLREYHTWWDKHKPEFLPKGLIKHYKKNKKSYEKENH